MMHSTREQSRVLKELCQRISLSVPTLAKRVERMEMEEQLERMLEEPLGIRQVSEFMLQHQLVESGVEILCRRGRNRKDEGSV